MRWPILLCVAAAAFGCSESDRGDDTTATAPTTLPIGTDDAEGSGPSSLEGGKLDTPPDGTGSSATAEGGDQDGCQKVDFLFVIDSSPSMEDEQDNLLASFPGFIAAIEQTLEIDDFHLMVADAGLILGADCDGQLGAGRITSATGQDCMLQNGLRYATDTHPDLTQAFTCMASRGADGPSNEQTMDSLLASIGPLNEPGACNEGFLRDDAVLVITIITDEEDSPADAAAVPALDGSCEPADADPNSAGDPASWNAAVVAAKNGDSNAVVVLALIGDCDQGGSCPGIAFDILNPAAPITGAEPAPRIRAFADLFGFGSVGPVCADDYAPFFTEAVSVIESACDDFVPPG